MAVCLLVSLSTNSKRRYPKQSAHRNLEACPPFPTQETMDHTQAAAFVDSHEENVTRCLARGQANMVFVCLKHGRKPTNMVLHGLPGETHIFLEEGPPSKTISNWMCTIMWLFTFLHLTPTCTCWQDSQLVLVHGKYPFVEPPGRFAIVSLPGWREAQHLTGLRFLYDSVCKD